MYRQQMRQSVYNYKFLATVSCVVVKVENDLLSAQQGINNRVYYHKVFTSTTTTTVYNVN